MNPEDKKNYSVDGSPVENQLTGIVSGETSSSEAPEDKKNQQRLAMLESIPQKYPQHEDIVRIFENASGISDVNERLGTVVDGLNALAREVEAEGGIEANSKRNRISVIVNNLRELL